MSSTSLFKACVSFFCVLVVVDHLVTASPHIYNDYDNLRDLYELLLRNEALPPVARFAHQMERKGGRSPSLRLRFGRRADPLWAHLSSAEARAIDEPEN
ncbi:short neuropeptide F-like isoform X2 [Tachypleus tridentatus]|uniref:short neuropeptide F-like isoform X2 n=1 Tax=Tachypleus tridentatus TaxID=6853 RepID=UPI003FD669C3